MGAVTTSPTRDRILAATLRVVAEDGVDAVTHRAVAARAQVSPGSTTHHFASRDHLLEEAFRFYLREGERMLGALLAEPADRHTDPVDRLERQLATVADRGFTRGLLRAEYELLLYASTRPGLAAEVRSWEARVVGMVAENLEAGGVARPFATARFVLNALRGFELECLLDPGLGADDFVERLAPFLQFLRGASA